MSRSVVSVIIPVYNAGERLRACLDSVLSQTYDALEIVAVNDGSTDSSLEILREYERADKRVHVLSTPNSGVSAARNLALSHATGEYLQFSDSDDTMPPDATQRMMDAITARSADIVIARYDAVIRSKSNTRGFFKSDMAMERGEFLDRLSKHPNSFYYSVLWNKLYRRNIVEANALRFDGSLPWGEDFAFNMSYYRYVRGAAIIGGSVYNYRRSLNGLSHNSVRLSIRRPFYSIGLKFKLYDYYSRLYREAGLYERYRSVLPLYLFKVTINN